MARDTYYVRLSVNVNFAQATRTVLMQASAKVKVKVKCGQRPEEAQRAPTLAAISGEVPS
jgi:hypothetical protein